GAGADGTLGIRAIKEAGGLVIVQDTSTAEQTSMPRSAIATGLVDYVLSPAQMPEVIQNYVANFLRGTLAGVAPMRIEDGQALAHILAVLRTRTGHDFALYKRNTILRRIQRRMTVRQLDSLDAYAGFLTHNPDEIQALFKEMLIGVTEFFRDPEAFELLASQVIPELLQASTPQDPLRVWVAACATGEEAYSVAILIREKMEELGLQVPVQIFATDIDEHSVDVARHGRYPASIAADVSPERLKRFFERADGGFAVIESVRKMIVFAPQSLVKDPPFSHVDLITCRNFLIYLEPELQRSIASVFGYALDPGGYLLLGTSEMLSETVPYFELVDRKQKLFRRLEGRSRLAALPDLVSTTWGDRPSDRARTLPRHPHLRQELERALLERYRPPTLIVDEEGRILFTYGDVGSYLQPSSGETGGWHVMRMLRERLRVPVATGVRHAIHQKAAVRHPGLPVDGRQPVDVVIRPIDRPVALEGLLFVEFYESAPRSVVQPPPGAQVDPTSTRRVEELERELQASKEYLQAVIEELQSSNEEIRSTNEELQSANEELETSQEEAQSMNEELVTLNNELESRVDELTWAN
ncbi:MAG TPA: CheR family methyltransferase, partial [Anaerolineae bacterium]|nr:CheR family methyltransferase [Anaerolineae bacterium]